MPVGRPVAVSSAAHRNREEEPWIRATITLAEQLIGYSVKLQPGEKIYIEIKGLHALDLGKALVKAATGAGGVPFWYYNDEELSRQFIKYAGQEQFQAWGQFHRPDHGGGRRLHRSPRVHQSLRPGRRRRRAHEVARPGLLGRGPHPGAAEEEVVRAALSQPGHGPAGGTATEDFADFYFDVCCLDYAKMSRAMDPLAELHQKADRVRSRGRAPTSSSPSPASAPVKCDGGRNIPDGEVYTAPVRDSMNGVIQYNTATMRAGAKFENIRFEVKDGKIVEATCDGDDQKLNELLDVDEGGRYFGEFAFGVNPYITTPMLDTLFDEKIGGSFHLTPGNAYDAADNGNRSALHWDIVCIQTPEWGGGEIWFDDS